MSNNIILNKKFTSIINNELFQDLCQDGKFDEFIDSDINLNQRDSKGRNALFWAIYHKQYTSIKKLINLGINTNVTHSLSAINYAIYKDDVKMIKCLKSCGLDINEQDDVQSTPLIYAVLYNKLQSIDYLINNGACLIHEDLLGNSALSLAYDLKIEYLKNKFKKVLEEQR